MHVATEMTRAAGDTGHSWQTPYVERLACQAVCMCVCMHVPQPQWQGPHTPGCKCHNAFFGYVGERSRAASPTRL